MSSNKSERSRSKATQRKDETGFKKSKEKGKLGIAGKSKHNWDKNSVSEHDWLALENNNM